MLCLARTQRVPRRLNSTGIRRPARLDSIFGLLLLLASQFTLQINGVNQVFESGLTVSQLLEHLSLSGKKIAVECNGLLISRSDYTTFALADGDRLEIVVAVGGG